MTGPDGGRWLRTPPRARRTCGRAALPLNVVESCSQAPARALGTQIG